MWPGSRIARDDPAKFIKQADDGPRPPPATPALAVRDARGAFISVASPSWSVKSCARPLSDRRSVHASTSAPPRHVFGVLESS